MNFYFECAKVLDRLDGKHGSIWSNLVSLEEKHRKRAAALVIETLKCMNTYTIELMIYNYIWKI